jgi:polysaccharide export outer membrane protein
MRKIQLGLTACLLIMLPGCASRGSVGAPIPELEAGANGSGLPALPGSTTQAAAPDRPIVPADLLEITVFEVPELSKAVRVSDAGDISLPLVGVTRAAGKTTRELEASLREQLQRSYMRDPHVTVEVKELGTPPIYVLGEVNQPGAFVPTGRSSLTVLRAVTMARGTRPTAAPGRVVVIRSVATGERLRMEVNMNDIVRGKQADLALQANDVVYVPKNTERSIALGAVEALIRTVTFRAVF